VVLAAVRRTGIQHHLLVQSTTNNLLNIPKTGIIKPIMGTNSIKLADALFSKVQQRVLAVLFINPERSFYTNEIVRHADMGVGAVQRELAKLVASGLVLVQKIGNQTHYQSNRAAPIFEELRSIFIKTAGLADVLRAALEPLAGKITLAFIYGSIAKGSDNAGSDIDLMLVGEGLAYADVYSALAACEAQLGRPVNPAIYSMAELRRRLGDDNGFVTKVLAQPKIFLIGSGNELPTP
jgi:predicted nucleotidyltransferase